MNGFKWNTHRAHLKVESLCPASHRIPAAFQSNLSTPLQYTTVMSVAQERKTLFWIVTIQRSPPNVLIEEMQLLYADQQREVYTVHNDIILAMKICLD